MYEEKDDGEISIDNEEEWKRYLDQESAKLKQEDYWKFQGEDRVSTSIKQSLAMRHRRERNYEN